MCLVLAHSVSEHDSIRRIGLPATRPRPVIRLFNGLADNIRRADRSELCADDFLHEMDEHPLVWVAGVSSPGEPRSAGMGTHIASTSTR